MGTEEGLGGLPCAGGGTLGECSIAAAAMADIPAPIPPASCVLCVYSQGSGLSEGQWVTLGAEEVDDVASAVEHLRSGGRVSTVGLWGRSMGAVTALLYSHKDPSIAGMVGGDTGGN